MWVGFRSVKDRIRAVGVSNLTFERLSGGGSWPVHGHSGGNYPRLWCFERHSLAFIGIFSARSVN